ncbi:MAG: GIY-YIG nuclease family protein [Leptolyngbyaceae cyanobacterium RM2_2_4]|nr:GIY-YIG nuclease family protein [Leptolyngbyaceae cyanobacterium RM2_2_4]
MNKIDGKQYIGQTIQSLKRRWAFHICKRSGCVYLKNAIKLHGKENFTIEEIYRAETLEELNRKEQEFIIKYNTLAPNGYNLTTGGERPKFSEETIQKMSFSKKGKPAWNKGLTKEDSRVQSYIRSGESHHFSGKKLLIDLHYQKTLLLISEMDLKSVTSK